MIESWQVGLYPVMNTLLQVIKSDDEVEGYSLFASPQTLIEVIFSSSSASHDAAKEEFKVFEVAASIFDRILDDISCGIALLGRWSGIGNAIATAPVEIDGGVEVVC